MCYFRSPIHIFAISDIIIGNSIGNSNAISAISFVVFWRSVNSSFRFITHSPAPTAPHPPSFLSKVTEGISARLGKSLYDTIMNPSMRV